MKWSILFNDYRPLRKEIDPVTTGLVASAGIGALSSIFGSTTSAEQSARNVRMQLAAQAEENQKNRDWQTLEAEKSRGFTTSERLGMQQYQTSERQASEAENLRQAQLMADLNAQYNSPQYMAAELRKAGINPNVYFSQHGSFVGSNQGTGVASHTSGAPSGPAPHGVGSVAGLSPVGFQPLDLQIPQLSQGIAALVQSASSANVGKAQIKELLSRAISTETDTEYKKQLIEYQDMMNQLFALDFPKKIEKSFLDVEILRQQRVNAQKQGKVFDSQVELNHAEAKLKKALEGLTGEQAFEAHFMNERLEDRYARQQELIKSEIRRNKAESVRALSAAELDKWKAAFERESKDARIAEISSLADKAMYDGQISEQQVRAAKAAAILAEERADHATALFWKDYCLDVLHGAIDVFQSFLDFKRTKAWDRLSKTSQDRLEEDVRQFNEDYQLRQQEQDLRYGDVGTDTYNMYDKQGRKHTYTKTYHTNKRSY